MSVDLIEDKKMRADFLQEAFEYIEELESVFLRLENDPNDRTIIDHIFRLVHTIKGSAYSIGFESLGSFAHVFETFLNMARDGRLEVDGIMVELMLKSNDVLKEFVLALLKDHDATIDTSDIVTELSAIVGDDMPQKWTGPAFGFFDDDVSTPIAAIKSEISPTGSDGKPFVKIATPLRDQLHLRSVVHPTILACDDDPSILSMIEDALRNFFPYPVNIITAVDGEDALQKIKTQTPHVIITDLKMPKLNGIEFLREVRIRDKNVPVLILSGFTNSDDMMECIHLGITDYMNKPLELTAFVGRVHKLLQLAQMREAIENLSALNFKSHINSVRLINMIRNVPDDARVQKERVERILEEIAALTNFVLAL